MLYSRELLDLLGVFHDDNNDNTKNDNMITTKTNSHKTHSRHPPLWTSIGPEGKSEIMNVKDSERKPQNIAFSEI